MVRAAVHGYELALFVAFNGFERFELFVHTCHGSLPGLFAHAELRAFVKSKYAGFQSFASKLCCSQRLGSWMICHQADIQPTSKLHCTFGIVQAD